MESLLVKQFKEHNIIMYGTHDKPLFKAKDIGDLLGIKDIKSNIRDFTDKQKGVHTMHTLGGPQEMAMLTEQGVYKLVMRSRKPFAEEFQDWICGVLEEIRKTGEYRLNKQIEYKTKNDMFIEQYQNKPVFYIGMVESDEEQQIVKYGYTQDTKSTLKRHQDTYGQDFHYVFVLECKEHYHLENKIQNHNDLFSRHVKKYNDMPRQELLRLDSNFTLKDLFNLVLKLSENTDPDKELAMERELTVREQEKTKQEEQKTEQMRIQLEMMKMQNQLAQPQIIQVNTVQSTADSEQPRDVIQEQTNQPSEPTTEQHSLDPEQVQPQAEPEVFTGELLFEKVQTAKVLLSVIIKRFPGNHLHRSNELNNYHGYSKAFKEYIEEFIFSRYNVKPIKNNGAVYFLNLRMLGYTSFYNKEVYKCFCDTYIDIPENRFQKLQHGAFVHKVEYEKLLELFFNNCAEIPLFKPRSKEMFTVLYRREFIEMICEITGVKPPSYTKDTIKYFNGIIMKN